MTPRRRIIPLFVPHLGCPHRCVFCDQRRIAGETQPMTAARAAAMIREGLAKNGGGPAAVAFYGGSFTAIPAAEQEALLGAVAPFLLDGSVESLRLSTRPDAVDEKTVERLRRYGVRTVELGVQSMDDEVLRLSGRGHTAADAVRAAGLLKAAGFELILQMMTGLPGDTEAKSLATAERLIALRPDGVRIYPTVILRGTALETLWRAGAYREHTVENAVSLCARLAERFDAAGIPVVRLGLNPTEALSGGEAVGGAYHPALGELVLSRRYLARAEALISEADRGAEVVFEIPPGEMSAAVGQRRENVRALTARYGLKRAKYVEVFDLKRPEIRRK